MAFSTFLQYFSSFIPGSRMVDGGDCLTLVNATLGVTTGVVATAGGDAATGGQLLVGNNSVDTCANDNDSVRAPPAIPGSRFNVWNNSAHTLAIFGQQANQGGLAAGDQICAYNSNTPAAVGTGITLATTLTSEFVCYVQGVWKQLYS